MLIFKPHSHRLCIIPLYCSSTDNGVQRIHDRMRRPNLAAQLFSVINRSPPSRPARTANRYHLPWTQEMHNNRLISILSAFLMFWLLLIAFLVSLPNGPVCAFVRWLSDPVLLLACLVRTNPVKPNEFTTCLNALNHRHRLNRSSTIIFHSSTSADAVESNKNAAFVHSTRRI